MLARARFAKSGICSQAIPFLVFQCLHLRCRQAEATAHLGAVLTGYDLLAMYIVRKLGLSLGKLDDVTSETKSVEQVRAEVNVFGSQNVSQ